MPRFLHAILVLVLFSGSGLIFPSMAESRTGVIAVLGDSLSEGYRLRESEAYPALLQEKIRAAGLNYQVINAGVSGDTTIGGLRRLPKLLERRIDLLLLELGINDAFRGVPISVIEQNLQSIMDQTRARYPEAKIVVIGLEGLERLDPDWGRKLTDLYPKLAKKNQAVLVPDLLRGVAAVRELNLPDGLHPNARGHQIMGETVWKGIEPLLKPPFPAS